jgi:hypothetical protein
MALLFVMATIFFCESNNTMNKIKRRINMVASLSLKINARSIICLQASRESLVLIMVDVRNEVEKQD